MELSEREKERKKRIEKELLGEPTGFDILVETKNKNIAAVCQLLRENPDITRSEICRKLKISMRSASRYLAEVYVILRKEGFVSLAERQLLEKGERVKEMEKIRKKTPNLPEKEIAKKLGISSKTLYGYKKVETSV